jgi:hypothetical protein
MSTHFGDSVGE